MNANRLTLGILAVALIVVLIVVLGAAALIGGSRTKDNLAASQSTVTTSVFYAPLNVTTTSQNYCSTFMATGCFNVTLFVQFQIIYGGAWNGTFSTSTIGSSSPSINKISETNGYSTFRITVTADVTNGAKVCFSVQKLDTGLNPIKVTAQWNDSLGASKGSWQDSTLAPFDPVGTCALSSIE